jgi:hypothetical protein
MFGGTSARDWYLGRGLEPATVVREVQGSPGFESGWGYYLIARHRATSRAQSFCSVRCVVRADRRVWRCQRWSAARANTRPAATKPAVIRTETPIFAADGSFVWSSVLAFRERWVSREGGFAFVLGVMAVCRRTRVTPCGRPVDPVDRFGVRVVAVRAAAPERVSVAAFDVLRERSELVVVLALARRGLVLGRA